MAASDAADNLTGLVGMAAQAMDAMGEWGVGLFTLAETVVPPIPSEVILPLAGYLAKQGSLSLVLVFITSTLGAPILAPSCCTGWGPSSAWKGPSAAFPGFRWWTGKTLTMLQAGSAATADHRSSSAACSPASEASFRFRPAPQACTWAPSASSPLPAAVCGTGHSLAWDSFWAPSTG